MGEGGKNLGLNRNPLCSTRLGDSGMKNADGRVCSCPFLFFKCFYVYIKGCSSSSAYLYIF